MAVTMPGLLRPDGLTITISQIPGVSLTLDIGQGGKGGGPAHARGGQLPLTLFFYLSFWMHPVTPSLMQSRLQLKGQLIEVSL